MINFTHLFAFYEVAKAGSVSGGAEKMKLSQPVVTREIRELEGRYGLQLFDRLPRGVSLTDDGRFLFDYAEKIFSVAEAAETQLQKRSSLTSKYVSMSSLRFASISAHYRNTSLNPID